MYSEGTKVTFSKCRLRDSRADTSESDCIGESDMTRQRAFRFLPATSGILKIPRGSSSSESLVIGIGTLRMISSYVGGWDVLIADGGIPACTSVYSGSGGIAPLRLHIIGGCCGRYGPLASVSATSPITSEKHEVRHIGESMMSHLVLLRLIYVQRVR